MSNTVKHNTSSFALRTKNCIEEFQWGLHVPLMTWVRWVLCSLQGTDQFLLFIKWNFVYKGFHPKLHVYHLKYFYIIHVFLLKCDALKYDIMYIGNFMWIVLTTVFLSICCGNESKLVPNRSGMVPRGPQTLLGHVWIKTFSCKYNGTRAHTHYTYEARTSS